MNCVDLNDKVLLIFKEAGLTSADLVNKVKRIINIKKIGHCGTLDKAAQGLMVVTTGKATKLSRFFLESDKEYIGVVKLGIVTDSCDREGTIIEENIVDNFDENIVKKSVAKFEGVIEQTPPVFSALKIDGKRASDLVREGKDVQIKPRKVEIKEITAFDFDRVNSSFKIKVFCSKGTYIRSLARDIGKDLGYGAHLSGLTRVRSGKFLLSDSVKIEDLAKLLENNSSVEKLSFVVSMEKACESMNQVFVEDNIKQKVLNGAFFSKDSDYTLLKKDNPFYAIYDNEKNIIAIADINIENWHIKYLNVFN